MQVSAQQKKQLKEQFKTYLMEKHPEWNDTETLRSVSNAFFAFDTYVGIDFWSCFTDTQALQTARDNIRAYLYTKMSSADASKKAEDCFVSMRYMKAFLDDTYQHIAKGRRETSAGTVYLKSAFRKWMQNQKKVNGATYSPNTIHAYVTVLKNVIGRLAIPDTGYADVFFCISPSAFSQVHRTILSSPQFGKMGTADGRKCARALALYDAFLKEYSTDNRDFIKPLSGTGFVRWFVPLVNTLKKLGGAATLEQIRLEIVREYPGKVTADETFAAELERVVPYLLYEGVLGKAAQDVLALTLRGLQTKMTETYASSIFLKWNALLNEQAPAVPVNTDEPHYWIYSLGEASSLWDTFLRAGIIAMGLDDLGDLMQYPTQKALRTQMQSLYGKKALLSAGTVWQFSHVLKPGDVLFAQKGQGQILGRGIITSAYRFDPMREHHLHIRSIQWALPGQAFPGDPQKTQALRTSLPF